MKIPAPSTNLWGGLGLLVCLVLAIALLPAHKAKAAACTAPSTDYGSVSQTVSVPATTTYRVWSRLMADSLTPSNDTYLLEIDGATCFTVGGSGVSTTSWTWVDYQNGTSTSKINAALSAGNHTIKMIGNAANVQLDRVIFTADTSCIPTGTGDNCANPPDTTPPSVAISSPANGATIAASSLVTVTATDDVAVSKVELRADGNLVSTDTASPYSFAVNLAAGTHTLIATAYDTTNNSATSSTVTVTVPDTTAPSISAIASGSISQTTATITWTTNEPANSQVEYGTTTYGTSTTLNTSLVTNHSVGLAGLTANTTYHYRVKSRDAAGNLATSGDNTLVTSAPAADTTKPTVSLTAPASNATVAGSAVSITAAASDNVGVVGVQFLLDGANLGNEVTAPPYTISWNSTSSTNGSHALSARARDAAGNSQTATNVNITVSNTTVLSEDINQDGHINLLDLSLFASKYGQSGASLGRADINGDGVVNLLDLSRLATKYGTI